MRSTTLGLAMAFGAIAAIAGSARALDRGGFDFDASLGRVANPFPGVVPGWTRVDLRFTNGDHHIRYFDVGPNGDSDYMISWGDGTCDNPLIDCGGEDDIAGSVRWADLSRYGPVRVTGASSCSGTCAITLPDADPAAVFVLLGFQVEWNRRVDHHVRELAIMHDANRGRV